MATTKQKKAIEKIVETRGNVSKAMREAGYDETTAKNPKNLTNSKAWDKLVNKRLSDDKLTQVHSELLNSNRLDHMVFPPEASDEFDEEDFDEDEDEERVEAQRQERVSLSDKDIRAMLAEVGCKVRRIVHGEMARHVYFWSPDNKARKEALDMAYKLKDKYPQRPGSNVVVPVQINFNEEKENYQ